MTAERFEIRSRLREHPFRVASVKDFELGESEPTPSDVVIVDPRLSLYAIDDEAATFVRTPEPLDLGATTFLYQTQFRDAERVVVVPLGELHRLARAIPFDEAAVVLLQSTGRCGSTLLSKVFAALPGVASWSEPDAFTQLAAVRPHDGSRDREIGGARTLFLYREALGWLDSVFRSLLRGSDLDDEQRRRQSETSFGRYHRLIAEHARPDRALSPAATWTWGWVSGVEKYLDLVERDAAAFAVRYEALRHDPETVVRAVLEQLGLCPEDFEPVREVLERDSQAGTSLARSEAGQAPATEARFVEEAARIVSSRPRIGRPDRVLPRTVPRAPSSGAVSRAPGRRTSSRA